MGFFSLMFLLINECNGIKEKKRLDKLYTHINGNSLAFFKDWTFFTESCSLLQFTKNILTIKHHT